MKHFIILAFSILLYSCNHSSTQSKPSTDKKYQTYTNKGKGFSLNYPAKWDTTQKVPNVIFCAIEKSKDETDRFNEGINVSVYPSEGKTMQQIIDDNIRIANQIYKTPVISQHNAKNVNGVVYSTLELKIKNQGLTLISNSSFFSNGTTIYTVTQIAEESGIGSYRPIMNNVINSFTFLK